MHWGYCSDLCKKSSSAQKLQEASLSPLTIEECAVFNTSTLAYREKLEVCAANKINYPKMKVYVRKKLRKPRNGKKFVFVLKEEKKNTVSSDKKIFPTFNF